MTVLKKIGQDIAGQMPAVDKKRLLMMNIPYVIVFYLADTFLLFFNCHPVYSLKAAVMESTSFALKKT